MECPGESGGEADFTVTNGTDRTIELTLDDTGKDDQTDQLDPGNTGRYFLGDDYVRGTLLCEDMDIVARDDTGELIARRRGPICRGFAWTVIDS